MSATNSNKTSYKSFMRGWESKAVQTGFPTVIQNGTTGLIKTDFVSYGPNFDNWRERLGRGENVTTSMEGVKHFMPHRSPVTYKTVNVTAGRTHSGKGYPETVAFLSGAGNAITEAATKSTHAFTKSYTKATTKWQSGVFLGELKEIATFLRNPVKHLYKATDDLASRMFKLKRRFKAEDRRSRRLYGQALADTWLAYAFAVRPLVQDADDAATALRAFSEGRTFDIIPVRGIGSSEIALQAAAGESVGFPGIANYSVRDRYEVKKAIVINRAGWKSDLPSGSISPLQTIGLTWLDVAPTLWELVPWSFLLDYFSNVGNVLDDLRLRKMSWAWKNVTTIRVRKHIASDWRVAPTVGNEKPTVRGGSQVAVHKSVSRGADLLLGADLILTVPGMERSRTWLNVTALTLKFLASKP